MSDSGLAFRTSVLLVRTLHAIFTMNLPAPCLPPTIQCSLAPGLRSRAVSALLALAWVVSAQAWAQDATGTTAEEAKAADPATRELAGDKPEISNRELFEKSLKASLGAFEAYPVYDNPEQLRRVADIGYAVAARSPYRGMPFSFYLVDMPEPNAFALPGGQIFVTRGMLDLDLDDNMLACLLGHEVAHVTESHGIRMQRRANLLNLLSQAVVLGVLVGVEDNQERANPYFRDGDSRKGSMLEGSLATSVVVSELLLRSYSRDFEDEADDEGQRLAAAAGYDPIGAQQLWQRMEARVPQSKKYGYWRTHPFSEQRRRSAQVRADELKIQQGRTVVAFREATQDLLLEAAQESRTGEQAEALRRHLESAALTAWPAGSAAEQIRLARLHRRRDAELERPPLERDYGSLLQAYGSTADEVRALTPDSPLLQTLERETETLRTALNESLPEARKLWQEGIFQTPFLETFLSNYPQVPEAPQVALKLGDAYSRLGRQSDAVREYLRASEAGPGSEAGTAALRGLKVLAGSLDGMAALEQLRREIDDETLGQLASKRLAQLSDSFEDIAVGAEYLRQYPGGEHSATVRERIEVLAQNLYGEVVLYQAVGDTVKSLERIQAIMLHAPDSAAAARLRDSAVVDG